MTRLAGIDIAAPPEIVVPIFLIALGGVAMLVAGLLRRVTTRWIGAAAKRGGSGRAAESQWLASPSPRL